MPERPEQRKIHFDGADNRPPSLLLPHRWNLTAIVGGIVTVALVYAIAFTSATIIGLITVAQARATEEPRRFDDEVPHMEFVEARFVKLGRQLEPRQLPNRRQAARTTAPRRSEVPTKSSRRVRIPPDAGPTPSDSVEDLLSRIGTRADEMARIAAAAEQEGDPEGIEEGTVSREEGDIYRGQIYAFFRRGLQRPTTIADSEIRGLRAVVRVETSPDGRIVGYEIRSSGNADFDQAVRLRMDQAQGSRLPDPPDEVRDQYYGVTFNISVSPPR